MTPQLDKTASHKTALVIGATGGIGGAVALALVANGWRVRAMNRNPARAAKEHPIAGVEWVKGDAMVATDVVNAAAGASLIVHGANPPGYKDWHKLITPMMQSSIAAAKATGARILLPGNVYNYDPARDPVVTETTPERPVSRKGRLRVAMERTLRESGVKALIVRAGDFYGPTATTNAWFAQMVRPGKSVRSVAYPGGRAVGHTWAYLPDLAETMVRLAEREEDLERYAVFNFGGSWFERGEDMAKAILRVAEPPAKPNAITAFPWPLVYLAAPFVPMLREVLEMRYLWKRSLRLDNAKLVAFLGAEPRTPLDQGIARALDALGCMPAEWPLATGLPVAA
jgi:nucleoside-diphosphate-sugar epimerase